MTGEIEAFGAAATAALAASTFDPPARPRTTPAAHGDCANCGARLTGDFCQVCGQSAHVHRSIGHVVEEFLHGIWHFDSKTWRTLPRLAFQPGRLTRDYVHGKRAAYIAPLALFLFSIFLMFFVFGFVGAPDLNGALQGSNADRLADARTAVADARSEVADAQGEIASAKADGDTPAVAMRALDASLATQRTALAAAEAKLALAERTPEPAAAVAGPKRTWQEKLAEKARTGKLNVNSGYPAIDANIRHALLNPDFAFYKVEQKAYKLSFLLVPLSLPTLWLLFVFRRGVRTYDHVVFALYSLSFMSLLFVVAVVASKTEAATGLHLGLADWLFFVPPIHMFVQLKGAYALGTGGALWRTVVLSIASLATLGLFAAMIVVVGLAD